MITENVDSWADQWELQGVQKGVSKTGHHILQRLIHRRFGEAAAEQSKPLLDQITKLECFEELADQLLLCTDADAWLNALRTAADEG